MAETVTGEVVFGSGVLHGRARVLLLPDELCNLEDGEILICHQTGPEWMDAFSRAKAVVTCTGGRLCHAAIIARGMGLPCVVGASLAMHHIRSGQDLTIDFSTGHINVVEFDTDESRRKAYDEAVEVGRKNMPWLDSASRWARFGEDDL